MATNCKGNIQCIFRVERCIVRILEEYFLISVKTVEVKVESKGSKYAWKFSMLTVFFNDG